MRTGEPGLAGTCGSSLNFFSVIGFLAFDVFHGNFCRWSLSRWDAREFGRRGNMNDPLTTRILKILAADGLKPEEKSDILVDWIPSVGWEALSSSFDRILAISHNPDAALVFGYVYFSAAMDGCDFNCNRVAALLLHNGIDTTLDGCNILLSICSEKKDVDYQTYNYGEDQDIARELSKLKDIEWFNQLPDT
jgi:hypothetical protein